MRLLICDDHAIFREGLKAILTSIGADLLEASDADAALATLAADSDIDLVLLDIEMPRTNGWTALEQIRKHHPGFGYRVELDENMNKFANLWPDALSTTEPLRDLGYEPSVGLSEMVQNVLTGHEKQNVSTADAFRDMDRDGSGTLTHKDVEKHVRKYLVRGREDYSQRRQDAVGEAVERLMLELDTDQDGHISWGTFSEWNRRNSVESVVYSVGSLIYSQ